MRILFIRHAEAVDRDAFEGDDLKRPLTETGRREARKAYKTLAKLYERPDLVLASEAVRAKATADVVCKAFRKLTPKVTPHLNPGAGVKGFRKLIAEISMQHDLVVMVGHEPDLSRIVSQVCAAGQLDLRVKKGAVIDVQLDNDARGELLAAVPLTFLGNRRKRGA